MKTRSYGTSMLLYESNDQETADLVGSAYAKTMILAKDYWNLDPPRNCHIYVMTSWLSYMLRSAPWHWRLLLGASFPIWGSRIRRTWSYTAGWTQRYGRKVSIGIKPPYLLEKSDRSIGQAMFIETKNMQEKVQHVACHELVHACSAQLGLPMWLNEGIAMVTVDRFLNKHTIRPESLDLVKDYFPKAKPPSYRSLYRLDKKAIVYHTVRGYWLVRYLEDQLPGLLRLSFSHRKSSKRIEQEIIAAFGMEPKLFWMKIDDLIANHFK